MFLLKLIHIKSTLKQALDYIENLDKTDGKMLVSSFGCSYETADIEFEMLLAQAMQKGNNLAHHLIQSFAPGEATPEQAHEIGRRLADEVLQGKYPYVLTTHIDKGHVHNHIIFCAADMVNCRKYVSNKQSYSFIRRTSDRLCREQGLSVVKPGRDRGQSYAEWDAQRRGRSWKAKLKIAIDAAIPQAKDFDDFLRLMERQGYEIKRGKFVSFRAPGQERFTRCKTLGEAYTEEAITERIQGRAIAARKPKVRKGISLRIDIENSIKAQQSAGYVGIPAKPLALWGEEEQGSERSFHRRWKRSGADFATTRAKIHNLQQAAKAMNFLTEHGIDAYPDLESRVAEISAASEEAAALKTAERRLGEMAVLIKNVTTYKQARPVAVEYRRAADKARFRQEERCRREADVLFHQVCRDSREAAQGAQPLVRSVATQTARTFGSPGRSLAEETA